MLRDEMELYTKLSGNDGEHTPIGIIGSFLDGYDKGKEDATKWIPCSERLPEVPSTNVEIENYLVCSEDGNITVMMWADGWNCTLLNGTVNRKYEIDDVIAWMPLPEPYKGKEE